ncbi:MAG: hypothetical protein US11_C0005G0024 [Candidatus Roizmanbacteria bacterium GW2011_GWA2_36_23]|uniref:Chromate transporter n=1 Tax=Candidatus Roizmanbacteria bacterium GW2011_GWA2_36_23 TaxID=1618480 RepID=A0A0G0E448_9BACT|nr:MAG: hypothetical protein US11_C0005G0024 [Candidatus Roizmanbacteria bacterium GW2011_GWA2_36_23]
MATKGTDFKSALGQLENTLEEYLVNKVPAIPDEWRELIVKLAPWFSLILMIIALPAILAVFGLGAIVMPFSFIGGVQFGVNYIITLAFSVVLIILEALAIPGLFKRQEKAWKLLYYATLLGGLQNIVTMQIGGLIGTLVSLYLLFQVKGYYK